MKKRTSYVLSKSTSERADSVLREIRIEQARLDLSKSNKRMGLRPLTVDDDTSEATTTTTQISDSNIRAS